MKGLVASTGMAYANSFVIAAQNFNIDATRSVKEVEFPRLDAAIQTCSVALLNIIESENTAPETAEILDFQLLMLEDTEYLGKINALIDSGNTAEYAVKTASLEYSTFLSLLTDNDYLRERAGDITDLANRVLGVLLGYSAKVEPEGDYIAIAVDLAPSQVAELDRNKLKGIILQEGGISSHSVIIAKSLGIPCLIGTTGIMNVPDNRPILLDAIAGEAIVEPTAAKIREFEKFAEAKKAEAEVLSKYLGVPSVTCDGAQMRIFANITSASEAQMLLSQGAEGVGLFRSELLYMAGQSAPSEEKQFSEYNNSAKALEGRPLVIRTLDVGGDKEIPYLNIPKEANPFLGFRAIRYCLESAAIFKTQLAAILRSSANGNVQIMFPMITKLEELRAAKAVVEEVKSELREKNICFDENIKIGIMIETPAAALDAQRLAKECDFFSLGTNDLTQYIFAADRNNAFVAGLNSYFAPVLLRTINSVAKAAHEADIEIDICGQAGEVSALIPLWIAMGIDAVSVSAPAVLRVRAQICSSTKADCCALLESVLAADTEAKIKNILCGGII